MSFHWMSTLLIIWRICIIVMPMTMTMTMTMMTTDVVTASATDNKSDITSSPGTSTTKIAFGSCHKGYRSSTPPIWETIAREEPDAFLWTGDAVYPSKNKRRHEQSMSSWLTSIWNGTYGIATLEELESDVTNLISNETIGYASFVRQMKERHDRNRKEGTKKIHISSSGNDDHDEASAPSTTNIFGTWDDHDYGGNDMGKYLSQRVQRQDIYQKLILGYSTNHLGMYHSIEIESKSNQSIDNNNNGSGNGYSGNDDNEQGQGKQKERTVIKILFLDTRTFRPNHCIPSLAHQIPKIGNLIACVTRWLTAGLNLFKKKDSTDSSNPKTCADGDILGPDQWKWLENEFDKIQLEQQYQIQAKQQQHHHQQQHFEQEYTNTITNTELIVIVSSIQVWTTNPAMESWGQFPSSQQRLYNLLERHYNNNNNKNDVIENSKPSPSSSSLSSSPPVLFLSGDVHHGEILGQDGFIEITSSGLTHHCGQPKVYGRFCKIILDTFTEHRYRGQQQNKEQEEEEKIKPPTTGSKDNDNDNYFIGLNYGILEVYDINMTNEYDNNNDLMTTRMASIHIKDANGTTVLSVHQPLGPNWMNKKRSLPSSSSSYMKKSILPSYSEIPHTWDGHLLPWISRIVILFLLLVSLLLYTFGLFNDDIPTSTTTTETKKKQ